MSSAPLAAGGHHEDVYAKTPTGWRLKPGTTSRLRRGGEHSPVAVRRGTGLLKGSSGGLCVGIRLYDLKALPAAVS